MHPESRTHGGPPIPEREGAADDGPAEDALARDDLPEDERIEQQNDVA